MTYELSLLPIVCTPVVPTADMQIHIIEFHQTYHRKNVTCFIGLIAKVIEIVLEI